MFCHSKTRISLTNPQKRRAGLVCSAIFLLLKSYARPYGKTDLPESSSLSFLHHTQRHFPQARRWEADLPFFFFSSPLLPSPASFQLHTRQERTERGTQPERTEQRSAQPRAPSSRALRSAQPRAARPPRAAPRRPPQPPAALAAPSPAHPMLIAAARSPHASRVTPPARPSQGGTDSAAGRAGWPRGRRGVCGVIRAAKGY